MCAVKRKKDSEMRSDYFEKITREIVKTEYKSLKRVITLRAPNGYGKTTTIKRLCKELYEEDPMAWCGRRNPTATTIGTGEISTVFTIEGLRIAIFSVGDTSQAMLEHFKFCAKTNVDILILAVRSSSEGREFFAERAFAQIKSIIAFQEEQVVLKKRWTSDIGDKEEYRCVRELKTVLKRTIQEIHN